MNELLRVAVVDDHPLMREGLSRTLTEYGFRVVAEGDTRDDAILIARREKPDIMLLDISLPGNGLEAIRPIIEHNPDQKIVMLTVSERGEDIRRAMSLGAWGYVPKGVGARALADALRIVSNGSRYVAPGVSAKLNPPQPSLSGLWKSARLSPREVEVLDLMSSGMTNKAIARLLGLQEKTVKNHVTAILHKVGASNRTQAAIDWLELRRRSTPTMPIPTT